MNIQRVQSELQSRVAPGPSRSVDMTVSENGVSINALQPTSGADAASAKPASKPVDAAPRGGAAQQAPTPQAAVTSTPDLQQLLSVEEIQALQQFSAPSAPATARPAMQTSVYDGRGTPVRVDESAAPGRLVDLVG